MKTLKRFILVSLLLIAGKAAFACGPWYYSAADNRIYRILPPLWQPSSSMTDDFETKNIMAWSRQTGCRDTAAIRRALYTEWNKFADWEALLYETTVTFSAAKYNPMVDNGFCHHLVQTSDTDAVKLLCWSKTYSNIRNAQRSPWYYNSRLESDESRQLRDLYDKVRQYTPAKKYADRYTFLTIKCGWALGEDSATVALWKSSKLSKKGNLFYNEAGDYAARCLTRMGRQKEADEIYGNNGNFYELIPYNASTPTRLRIMLQKKPQTPPLAELQEFLYAIEVERASSYRWEDEQYMKEADSLVIIARMAIANNKVRHKASWRFAAACALDYLGKPKEALAMLRGAENGDGDAFLRKSVRALTFYLRSRTDVIDDDFENYAIREVKWLDGEMIKEWKSMPDNLKKDLSYVVDWSWTNKLNDLYSYAALRRIMLEDSVGLAWRMAEVGRGVRALQMANVADNHLTLLKDFSIIKKLRNSSDGVYIVYYWGNDNNYHETWIATPDDTASLDGKEFGVWKHSANSHDYSNGLFCLADRMDAKTLEAYRQRQLHPKDENDEWFNARGYTNGDYWQDIIGTHYLRECNYKSAAAHLKYISPSYQHLMNIRCSIDPFWIDRSGLSHDSTHYKLHFAQRMDSLQKAMLRNPDADSRGLAMLEYSIGLENSFNMCWWLTSYGKGWNGSNLTDIEETEYAKKADTAVKTLRKKALNTLRSKDAHARYYLRLGKYGTVRKRYADTPTGMELALVCDEGKLYRTNNPWKIATKPSLFILNPDSVTPWAGYQNCYGIYIFSKQTSI